MWFEYGWSIVEQHALGVDVERAVGRDRVLGDDRVAVVVGVVEPCQGAVGGEGDPEQAPLAVGARAVGDVGDLVDRGRRRDRP